MTVVVRWRQGEQYYQRLWRDVVRHRLRARRRVVPLGLALIAVGAAILIAMAAKPDQVTRAVAIGAVVCGALSVVWHYADRARWFRMLRAAPQFDQMVEAEFGRDGIRHEGPIAHGEMSWAGIERLVRGDCGLFLVVQRGMSIYVPYEAFDGEQGVQQVEAMFDHACASGVQGDRR